MPVLLSKVKFDKSQYYDDFCKEKKKYFQQGVPAGPTYSVRRNNPHPNANFLLPKTMKQSDADQFRVNEATKKYLDYLGYSQTNPPTKVLHNVLKATHKLQYEAPGNQGMTTPEYTDNKNNDNGHLDSTTDFIQESLKLLGSSRKDDMEQLKRERGYTSKKAAKDYATTPVPPRSAKPVHTVSNGRSSKLLSSSGEELVQSMKRAHPTTSPRRTPGSRPRSVGYEEQRQKREMWRPMTVADFSAYNPRMKLWIEGANEFEKEVAYNLFNSLRNDNSFKKKGSILPNATRVYVPGGYASTSANGDKAVQQLMKQLEEDVHQQRNMPNVSHGYKQIEGRSHHRQIRRAPSFDDYMHIGSQFSPTRPPFRKSFDIAPDWCSEGKTYRRLIRKTSHNQINQSV